VKLLILSHDFLLLAFSTMHVAGLSLKTV